MADGLDELRGMTKPDGNHVWNRFGMIEGLVVYFETQIDDWLLSLGPKNVQTWRMTRDEEDDDICNLEDNNELSLEFTFDRNIRIKGFP